MKMKSVAGTDCLFAILLVYGSCTAARWRRSGAWRRGSASPGRGGRRAYSRPWPDAVDRPRACYLWSEKKKKKGGGGGEGGRCSARPQV